MFVGEKNGPVKAMMAQREKEREMERDAKRYRWLKSQYDGVDFDYIGDGTYAALIFDWPKDAKVSADLDATIDAVIEGNKDV
jgi:hypothetical protein